MTFSDVLMLLSGVALFLFGMSLMSDGLKKVAGSTMEMILFRLSGTPLKGILLGAAVTAVIQSSTATSVMVVGFVNSGMMKFRQAISVIMGAIIGTSITGWIICLSEFGSGATGFFSLLSMTNITAVTAVIGIILFMFTKSVKKQHIGGILLGFAVLMFGINTMSESVYNLRESEAFLEMMVKFSNPIVGILIGLAFTALIQSASAAVGILQTLSFTGAITFSIALPMIMGIAIGASIHVLLLAIGANVDGKRTAFSYMFVDFFGAVIFGIVFYSINAIVHFSFMDMTMNTVTISALNTVFRIIIVGVLMPAIPLIEKLCKTMFRDDPEEVKNRAEIDRLEVRFLEHPALAIEQSRLTVNSMAEKAQKNLQDAFALYDNFSEEGFSKVKKLENTIDKYEDKLGSYLVQITGQELTEQQKVDVGMYMHNLTDLERISDHARNIAETFRDMKEKNVHFSDAASNELHTLMAACSDIVNIAVTSFKEGDTHKARRVEPLEDQIDVMCDEMKAHHIQRIQEGICTYEHAFYFNDLITNMERVSDHCSNVGIALIEIDKEASFDVHEYTHSMKKLRNEDFDRLAAEYAEKYRF